VTAKKKIPQRQWRRVDVHVHTPASADYQDNATILDILQKAEERGMDIIAFTDHNSVAGYARMLDEIEQLELLERLQRIRPDEKHRLDEYRRVRQKLLVLPGFEFTATFGFHVLAIFPESTSVREIEHILLTLNVPAEKIDQGSSEVGATTDVLRAYQVIAEAGGLVIAAHANSTHGVATVGAFSGQTKIAYTQDSHLHALEVTDLESRGRRTTAKFFDGSKPEYPRRMHCIQGSDSHRLTRDPQNAKNLGVAERATEMQLAEVSFAALKDLFLSGDFARSRPYRPTQAPFDFIRAAREEGQNIVQAFHEGYTQRGGRLYNVIADVCAFANTNGGTIYVGVPVDAKQRAKGVDNVDEAIKVLRSAVQTMITPQLDVSLDVHESDGAKIVRLSVPRGDATPYAIDDNKIYVRDEAETSLAVRDEIVQLVRRGLKLADAEVIDAAPMAAPPEAAPVGHAAPRTGVEIVAVQDREGVKYYTMRDMRNGNMVHNVTRRSARKLWGYAVEQHEKHPVDTAQINWVGDLGLLAHGTRVGKVRYDLVQRLPNGSLRVYYGVTDDGIHGEWKKVVGLEE
jgi:PHP family Zn ribbon phosphoesterase